jgi:N-methylhydantoinase A
LFSRTSGEELASALDELGQRAISWLARQGVDDAARELQHQMDVRYFRQGYALPQDVDPARLREGGLSALATQFDESHRRLYGFDLAHVEREIVHLRSVGLGRLPPLPLTTLTRASGADASEACVECDHRAYFDGELLATPVYDRDRLRAGHCVRGPAIVTEVDSTTLIEPGAAAQVDETGNLLIRPA